MEESESKAVFLLHLHPSSQETFIQTLGKNELETSQRFSLSSETVSQIIQHENKTLKWDENINSEILAVFTEMFDDIHYRITVVPIVKKQNCEYILQIYFQPNNFFVLNSLSLFNPEFETHALDLFSRQWEK